MGSRVAQKKNSKGMPRKKNSELGKKNYEEKGPKKIKTTKM